MGTTLQVRAPFSYMESSEHATVLIIHDQTPAAIATVMQRSVHERSVAGKICPLCDCP